MSRGISLRKQVSFLLTDSFSTLGCFFYQVHIITCVYFIVTGSTITAEIQGVIDACVKLTGMPDLTLSFMVKLKDVSLFRYFERGFPALLLRSWSRDDGSQYIRISVCQTKRERNDNGHSSGTSAT